MISNQSDALSLERGDFCSTRSTVLVIAALVYKLAFAVQSHSCLTRVLVSGWCKLKWLLANYGEPVSDAEI